MWELASGPAVSEAPAAEAADASHAGMRREGDALALGDSDVAGAWRCRRAANSVGVTFGVRGRGVGVGETTYVLKAKSKARRDHEHQDDPASAMRDREIVLAVLRNPRLQSPRVEDDRELQSGRGTLSGRRDREGDPAATWLTGTLPVPGSRPSGIQRIDGFDPDRWFRPASLDCKYRSNRAEQTGLPT